MSKYLAVDSVVFMKELTLRVSTQRHGDTSLPQSHRDMRNVKLRVQMVSHLHYKKKVTIP